MKIGRGGKLKPALSVRAAFVTWLPTLIIAVMFRYRYPKIFRIFPRTPWVVDFLRNTYRCVEDIDFYIGLFAEDPMEDSPLPPLILRMVAVDAFSQALTNPLLSKHVYNEETFSAPGWRAIHGTRTLWDILDRNTILDPLRNSHIGMTLPNWKPVC
ncbi:MAG: hypothetical protein M3Q16_06880 [Pseudomonadota bacterium]|nr:hypothetical protein [Pseudomonadota bacterium]